jgi:hypothetical protein
MSIHINESAEPMADSTASGDANLARSAAYDRLCSELSRYAQGQISGRSFLISGHRGAGKTTLVLKAIEDTDQKVLKDFGMRLLRVPLHGPDLLPKPRSGFSPVSRVRAGRTGKPKGPDADPVPAPPASDTKEFLRQVTIGMYRALSQLFHENYRKVAQFKAASRAPRYRNLPELAAQLRIELDGAPDLALLREYWNRADALSPGILELSRNLTATQLDPGAEPAAQDRGMMEIVALASAIQAYQVVRGKLTAKEGRTDDVARKRSIALQTVGEVKNILNPLLGLVAGGAVGLGLKGAVPSFVAALAGTATGLGAALSLNFASSRSQQSSRTTEMTFLPDTSIASLDRMLPLLVNRCRQAGIAPVFVVDELDKVEDLVERMGPLVFHLKSLVTEKAFFCFLADRSYLETLRRTLAETPYGAEYTYFSDRLRVLYRPAELHKYLYIPPEKRNSYTPMSFVLELGGATWTPDDNDDCSILPYVLLHRSRLHPFDLRRQLSRMRDAAGAISLSPGSVRSDPAYRDDVLIQVAVEWLLDQPELRERLSQDEDFTQLVYDTLYYPSRVWEQGLAELDVSRPVFVRYIAQRMGPESSTNGSGMNDLADLPAENCLLSALDQDFLYLRLRELVMYIAAPERLLKDITVGNPGRFSTTVLQALPKARLLESKSKDVYVWRRDVFGRSVKPPLVDMVLTDSRPNSGFIAAVQNALALIGAVASPDRLSTEYGVLSSTPAWTAVQQSMRRLNRLATAEEEHPEPYAEMEADSNAVWEYARMLEESGPALAAALIAARILGQVAPPSPSPERGVAIANGIVTLSNGLNLKKLSPDETRERLLRIARELQELFPWLAFDEARFELRASVDDPVKDWNAEVTVVLDRPELIALGPATAEEFRPAVEGKWQERFDDYFRTDARSFEPKAAELLCDAAHIGMSSFLCPDLDEVPLASWSNLLLAAFTDSHSPSYTASPLFGFPALFELGFEQPTINALNRLQFTSAPLVSPSKAAEFQKILPVAQQWVSSWAFRRPASAKPAVLVILDNFTLGGDWKRSTDFAAVIVHKNTVNWLRQALQVIWTPGLFERVVIEVTPPVHGPFEFPAPSMLLGTDPELISLPCVYASATPVTATTPPGTTFVLAPKRLDEVARAQFPTTAPATSSSKSSPPA